MKICVLESLGIPDDALEKVLQPLRQRGHKVTCWSYAGEEEDVLAERVGDAEAVILANMPFPDSLVEKLPHLKILSVAFTGVDHVGTQACKDRGILVSNAAGYATEATAEMGLLLILGALRRAGECHKAVLEGKTREGLCGGELTGKTVGILGTGAIGVRLGELLLPFGCTLLGWSRSENPQARELGITYVSFEEILEKSDVLSLHLPLTPGTRGLLGEEELRLMKPGAVLVNVARGPVVDMEALAKVLEEGHLGAAGIDVFETEPPLEANHPLLRAPRVFLAPHVGFFTREALESRGRMVVENILAWEDGIPRRRVL